MPIEPFVDFERIDLGRVIATKEDIRRFIKQRGRFEMLDAIVHCDHENDLVIGYADVEAGAWWSPDHIPGRPIFPGALMIEAAAQLCTYDFISRRPEMVETFVGFAGVDRVRFRAAVEPECRLYFAGRPSRIRSTMFTYQVQGFVDRRLVFEGEIMGMAV